MTNNAVLRVASKKTIALLIGVATLGAGVAGTTAVFANTGSSTGFVTTSEGTRSVPATAPTQDYAKQGTFTASTGTVNAKDVTDGGDGYKPGTADSYWLQVDLGKARSLTGVTVKFLANGTATGLVQYTNDDKASNDPASAHWTDFTQFNGATGTFSAPAGTKVVNARYVRVLVNKTTLGDNAPADAKAADVAGIADFQVNAATVYATGFETKGLENIANTHYGDHIEFTTRAIPADADVKYDTTGTDGDFKLTQVQTDADGTTHWTLDVVHSTSGEAKPIVIKNTVVKATDDKTNTADGYQTVYQGTSASWAYADHVSMAAFEGNQLLFVGDTANGGQGASVYYRVDGEKNEPAKQDVTITSDNEKAVTVDKSQDGGVFYAKGVGVGNAKVTVTAADVRAGKTVDHSVNFQSQYHTATGFTDIAAPSEIVLGSNGENKISAKVTPVDTANQALDFKSSDEKTLSVGADGVLTPHVEGLGAADSKQVTITATAKPTPDGAAPVSFTQTVTVKRPSVTSINVESGLDNDVITLGDATEKGVDLKATVGPEFSNPEITWASNNEAVATVDQSGHVKFTGTPGFVAITATSAHGAGGANVYGSTSINVVRPALTGLVAYKASDKTQAPVSDLDFKLGTDVTPVDLNVKSTPKYADDSVYWLVGDATVANVDAATGVVTPYGAGSTTVAAVSKVDGTIQARVNVKVTAPKPKAETVKLIAPKDFASGDAKVGDEIQLDTVVTPTDVTTPATWSSSDPDVATVSKDGKVTAVKPGKAVITADVDGVTADYHVNVTDAKPDDTTPDSKAITMTFEDDHNPDGGYLQVKEYDNHAGDKINLMVPPTEAKGYTFKGWTTDKDRTKFVDAENYTVPDEDTTLYAAWVDKDGNIYTPDSDATDNEGDGQETGDADKTGTSDDNKKQSNDKQTATQPDADTTSNDSTDKLAKTGAAVGVFGAIAAALTGAGVSLKKFSKRHAE